MKIAAIIQARMNSTRLPGKVLARITGRPMLEYVVRRARAASLIDEVVVATTNEAADDQIIATCRSLDTPCLRGDEDDVLRRYYEAAVARDIEVIVRITSDCPLIDPGVVDRVIEAFLGQQPDYASNTLRRTWPRGLDTEVFTLEALSRAHVEAVSPYQRVHVTPYFYENPMDFRLLAVCGEVELGSHRWTVDTPDDLALVRSVYSRLVTPDSTKVDRFTWRDVLAILEREPSLAKLNCHVRQKALVAG